jgi:AMMECR1 domain-containing protein
VVHNAIDSATRDPRFLPVEADELDELSYSVDVLSPPEPVGGPEELDHRRYGLIVRNGLRRGLLLPDIEGVGSVEEQVAIAKVKAGIHPDEPVELFRFTVSGCGSASLMVRRMHHERVRAHGPSTNGDGRSCPQRAAEATTPPH